MITDDCRAARYMMQVARILTEAEKKTMTEHIKGCLSCQTYFKKLQGPQFHIVTIGNKSLYYEKEGPLWLLKKVWFADQPQSAKKELSCLFCHKPKKQPSGQRKGKLNWISDIAIDQELQAIVPNIPEKLYRVTVCPACRNSHTIQELYEAAIKAAIKEKEQEIDRILGEEER